MPRPKKEPSLADLVATLQEGIKRQATEPNIYGYKPHPKQLLFHQSTKKKRAFLGGNRSGKTTSAVVEDIYWLRGEHPYRAVPEPPIRGRVVGVDYVQGVQKILLPQFGRWIPPSLLKNGSWEDSFNKELRTLTLNNRSTVEFMSYEQETEKFAGTSRHFVHYDEEPPLHVFNECNARLIDVNGSWWISMTPLDGMTWVYDQIFVPWESGDESVLVVEVDMLDNPVITAEAAEDYLKGLDDDERKAREHGQFVSLGGRVYKSFSEAVHVIEPFVPDPVNWEHYISLDHGFNNPTAVLWHAVDPDGNVVTYDEHYASEMVVAEHAEEIKRRNMVRGFEPTFWVADPALAQRQGVTGISIFSEYADHGCFFAPGNNDVASGVQRINQYLAVNPKSEKPRWTITSNCVNLIREMKHLRWATYASKGMNYDRNKQEKIHKKDDHACDSARYFFSFMPDLAPQEYGSPVSEENVPPSAKLVANAYTDVIDKRLAAAMNKPEAVKTQWKLTQGSDLAGLEYD